MHRTITKVIHSFSRPAVLITLGLIGLSAAGCAQPSSDFLSNAPYYQTNHGGEAVESQN